MGAQASVVRGQTTSSKPIVTNGITDLDAVVLQWAESKLKSLLGIKNRKKVRLEINWSRIRFTRQQSCSWRKSDNNPKPPRTTTIHAVAFSNNSDTTKQETLNQEKSSTAALKARMTKGFSTSVDLGLKIDIPEEVASDVVVFGRKVNIGHTSEEVTIEQQQKWTTNLVIPIPPRSLTKVRVEVTENVWTGSYSTEVQIKGMLVVNIYDKSPEGKHLGVIEKDIQHVLTEFNNDNSSGTSGPITPFPWVIEGECSFEYGVDTKVSIVDEPIENGKSDDEPGEDNTGIAENEITVHFFALKRGM